MITLAFVLGGTAVPAHSVPGGRAPTVAAASPEHTARIIHDEVHLRATWRPVLVPRTTTELTLTLPSELGEMQLSGLSWWTSSPTRGSIDGRTDGSPLVIDVQLPDDLEVGESLLVSVIGETGPSRDQLDLMFNVSVTAESGGDPSTFPVSLALAEATNSDFTRVYTGDTRPALMAPGASFDLVAPTGFWSEAAAPNPDGPAVMAKAQLSAYQNPAVYDVPYTISADGSVLQLTWPDPIPEGVDDNRASLTVSFVHPLDSRGRVREVTFRSRVVLPQDFTTERVGGADRYEVSAAVAKRAYPGGAAVAYVVTGESFPDALSAAPAAVTEDGPLLLTTRDSVPEVVLEELRRIAPERIVVVGGPASVSERVVSILGEIAATERIGGADRFEVSRNVLKTVFTDDIRKVYVATGGSYPDALSAAAIAGSERRPVILVDGSADRLDAETEDALGSLNLYATTVVGGYQTVSEGIDDSLQAMAPTTRLGGVDRYDTSRLMNAATRQTITHAYLVSGEKFPDALVGSAWAGQDDVLVFTTPAACIPGATLAALQRMEVDSVTLIGGTASLSPAVEHLDRCE